jgi:hypothetical protein
MMEHVQIHSTEPLGNVLHSAIQLSSIKYKFKMSWCQQIIVIFCYVLMSNANCTLDSG